MNRRSLLKGLLAGAGLALIPSPLKASPLADMPVAYGQLRMGSPAVNVVTEQVLVMSPQAAVAAGRRMGKTASFIAQIEHMCGVEVAVDPLCPAGMAYLIPKEIWK